jgi:membrane-associated phospholipid phosphatase
LPAAVRPLAVALVAVCVTVVALLGSWLMGETRPGRLDTTVDHWVRAALGGQVSILSWLVKLGDPTQVTVMTTALVLACLATRRWRGAVLFAVSVPAAGALTEHALKPFIDRTLQGHPEFPSGHVTGTFALAVACVILLVGPLRPRLPAGVRAFLALAVLLAAGGVAAAVVALQFHFFTDTVGGAAVATAVVLTTALLVDRLSPRGAAGESRADQPARSHVGGAATSAVGDLRAPPP